ncbi:MAG: hypothetical protein WCJ30_11420 [Deltaproteobacteria bacterium]
MELNRSLSVCALSAVAVCLWTGAAFAQPVTTPVRLDEDPSTARTMALGGRAEATASSSGSMFSNPASILGARGYHTEVLTMYDPTIGRYLFGSALTDSTRQYISAGLAYFYSGIAGTDQRSMHDTRINATFALSPNFGIGIIARYVNATGGPPLMNGTSLTNSGAWAGFLLDAGIYVRPFRMLQISASGHSLNNQDTTIAPINMGVGLALSPVSILTIAADALIDFRQAGTPKGRYSGGVELFLGNHFPIRAGYAYDDLRATHAVTAGFGYMDDNFGIELGVRQGVYPEMQTTLMLAVRYFYRGALQ